MQPPQPQAPRGSIAISGNRAERRRKEREFLPRRVRQEARRRKELRR